MAGWGALLGGGLCVVGGFFTGGLTWGLLAAGAAGTAAGWGAEQVITKIGDNLRNDLQRAGIPPEIQYQDYLDWKRNRDDYYEKKCEREDEHWKQVDERLKDLQEENKGLGQRMANENDPQEKAKLLAMINANKKEIGELYKQKTNYFKRLDKSFEAFGRDNLTPDQFQAKASVPSLASFKNWGIIALCVFLGIMFLNFLKKMFDRLTKATD